MVPFSESVSRTFRSLAVGLVFVLLLVAGVVLVAPQPAAAAPVEFTDGDFTFQADTDAVGDGATVTDYMGGDTEVTIPGTVTHEGQTYDVTVIGANALRNRGLTGVTIPESVISIGNSAFFDNALGEVTIPGSVTSIGAAAFGSNELRGVTIPGSVTSIGNGAFANNALASVVIPGSVTIINGSAFANNALESVVIPGSVTIIGASAFQDNALESVTIPGSVTIIGNEAFAGNSSLTEVWFEGDAPQIAEAVPPPFFSGSFGEAGDKFLFYLSTASGFSSPTWQGYNTRVVAVYRTVTFETGDGTDVESVLVGDGETLTPPGTPTREGYGFTGWFTDADAATEYDFAAPVTEDLTLYAGWEINFYEVVFRTGDGSSVDPVGVAYGGTIAEPEDPTLEGYTFSGWLTDPDDFDSVYDFDTPVTEALILYAGWEIDAYTVAFETGDGSAVEDIDVEYGETVSEPETPVWEGYEFTGWFTDAEATTAYDFDTPVTGDLILYAGWQINVYAVTFETGDGTPVEGVEVEHGEILAEPETPTLEGHGFEGWLTHPDDPDSVYDFDTPVTGDLTLYAGWAINTYAVTFETGDGSAVEGVEVEHGETFVEPNAPTLEGYTFVGWLTDPDDADSGYDFDMPVTGDLTLYAGWAINTYAVAFETGDGTPVDGVTVEHGETLTEPDAPTRDGYGFTGWLTDPDDADSVYEFDTPVTGDLTLYAGWQINVYAVTFETGDGTPVEGVEVEHDDTLAEPETPTLEGYEFTGWLTDPDDPDSVYDFDTPVTGDLTLYAGWEEVAVAPEPTPTPDPEQDALPETAASFPALGLLAAMLMLGTGAVLIGRTARDSRDVLKQY